MKVICNAKQNKHLCERIEKWHRKFVNRLYSAELALPKSRQVTDAFKIVKEFEAEERKYIDKKYAKIRALVSSASNSCYQSVEFDAAEVALQKVKNLEKFDPKAARSLPKVFE